MNKLYEEYIKTDMLPTLFCPGCGNGIVQGSVIRAIDRLNIRNDIACVSGIGCSSWILCYIDIDVMHTIHGRALAFAQGLKLAKPDKKVLVVTGDGDCLAIGGNHLIHACNRNINLTVVMVNNMIYGMTGGQKSPTTPRGSMTKTSPRGSIDKPLDACKLAISAGATYVARWTGQHPFDLEKSIADGMAHKGFTFIEVLAQCPVQAGKEIYGTREPSDIMDMIKAGTSRKDEEGKHRIGILHRDDREPEYLSRMRGIESKEG